ncbi:MFS transporter [Micromonospora sp. NPDC048871]|uniref:MFS transporter n=1 Tax=unclassified Micromonospora TaxID=2617518 RepID=UPI002E0F5BE1|nr:MFS transporter [Micromonospora sp. NBC_01739]
MVSDERPPPEGPATFREVFAQGEYRAVFLASTLTWIGDYVAKAAVTLLVYRETDSVALSAAAFAVSYLPWLIGGPLLATIAERHRYRQIMVVCDLIRMALMLLIAIPGIPVPLILALLFATTLANPPSQAARSALMPLILPGDRLVVGISVNASVGQAAQVVGYLLGAAVATVNTTAALVMNATAFAISAALVRFGVRDRAPAMPSTHRRHLLRETADGFQLVFRTPVLRAIAILVFGAMLCSIVPEGLAAAWANERADGGMHAGVAQALIMASSPVGFILGGLLMGRAVAPARRIALLRPLAVIAPLVLVPALLDPPPAVVALLAAACGFAVAGILPVANSLFVQALPHGYRARAFGVMATGVQVIQGAAVLATGLLAEHYPIPIVVGLWSAAGVVLMALVARSWPDAQTVAATVEAAQRTPAGAATPPEDPDPGSVGPGRPRHAVS